MDPVDSGSFRITMRRYGPSVHLLLAGEVDHEAEPAMTEMCAGLPEDVVAVACDLHHVSYMDVAGLHCVLTLQRHCRLHGVTVLVYNWQPQPLRLLHLALNSLDHVHDDDLRGLREILREHSEAQLALGIPVPETSARTYPGRARSPGRIRHPGPPPAAR
ncbi:STAS domain-containing protein [Streptomyces sp. NPDC002587]